MKFLSTNHQLNLKIISDILKNMQLCVYFNEIG